MDQCHREFMCDENFARQNVADRDFAKYLMDANLRDLKNANDRENSISDQMILSQIQAAAIFIALQAAFLEKLYGLVERAALASVLFLASSIVFGVVGFYKKEEFWISESNKFHLIYFEWQQAWSGKSENDHAMTMTKAISSNQRRSQSVRWPGIMQAICFAAAMFASFIALIVWYAV